MELLMVPGARGRGGGGVQQSVLQQNVGDIQAPNSFNLFAEPHRNLRLPN